MVKRIMIFKLKDGVNPDKFWKFWDEEHAQTFKKLPALKKYVLNRVTKIVKGEPKYWGLVEIWAENEEAYEKTHKDHPIVKELSSHGFSEQITDTFTAWVEEKVIL